jgi:two-component system alkaline phosphatase synthesis response regulator PhoP
MPRVLIVEDEPDIAMGLEEDLSSNGYSVTIATDGDLALRQARAEPWDLILLDVMLPRRDGFEVCRQLRRDGIRTPIILLTAKTHEAEKVLGLELGADDYVTKPFSLRELRARMQAVLRRTESVEPEVARFGDCEVDFGRAELRRAGKPVDITALELRLLQTFLRRRGLVFTRTQLIQEAWGGDTFVSDRVVDTHILNLRKKIEPDPAAPVYLRSVRGIGYRFDA